MIITLMSLQTFMDIAVLVDAQGDMLDNIESQVFFITLHITPSSNQDKKNE